MQKIKTALIITVVIALALISFFRHAHNKFVDKSHIVEVASGKINIELKRRHSVVTRSRTAVKEYLLLEGTIFERLATLNGLIRADAGGNKTSEMETKILALITKLEMIKEAYPELKTKDPYLYFMETVQDAGRRVTRQRLIYNEAAYEFNRMLNIFPYKFIAWFLRFDKEPFFQAESGAEVLPALKSLLNQGAASYGCSGCQTGFSVSKKES